MRHVLHYSEIDSTQRVALCLAREGATDGIAVRSGMQTRGKGRGIHAWHSPPGGVYVSAVVEPDPMGLHLLSLTTGLEVARVLSEGALDPVQVKWPNDIVTEKLDNRMRKLAGILTDVISVGHASPLAVVGLGINVRPVQLPPEVEWQAAFLDQITSSPRDLDALTDAVLGAVDKAVWRVSQPEERAQIGGELNERLWGIGKEVAIDGVKGVFLGVGDAGEAVLSTAAGKESFFSGDLTLLER